jgi:hypothetical protein
MSDNQAHAKGSAPPIQPNPALEPIAFLAGGWEMELSNASFLPSPSDTAKSPASVTWEQEGAFLVTHMGDKQQGTPTATWLIGRDESAPTYTVLYFDARKVSRVYSMSFTDNEWRMWREAPGFSQRFVGIVSPDRNTITAHWEKSFDGTTWEHDFDVMYKRRG